MIQRLLTFAAFLLACQFSIAQSDLIITGAFDGDLSGGTPKGVELYVVNDIPDLSIYGLEAANNGGGTSMEEFTFPADAATAGDFIYVTIDNAQFNAFFGFDADYENGGNPSAVAINGDDAVVLYKEGVIVDVFGDPDTDGTGQPWEYTDGWGYRVDNTGPDPSFALSNWTYALGGLIDAPTNSEASMPFPIGTYIFGTAVLNANDDLATVPSGESVEIDVLANDQLPNGFTSFNLVTNPANGTAVVTAANTVTYTPDVDFCGTDSFTYEVCDDTDCSIATVTIDVSCFPEYPIGLVTTVNEDGVADSLDVFCQLQGVVHGVNLRPGGLEFAIIDDNKDGITVFSLNETFGYDPTLGDEVIVRGAIDQFNGLTQIAVDTIWTVSTGNSLFDPTPVTALGEATESQLVLLENVSLVSPGDWDNSGGSFNFEVTDGTNTYNCRIDSDVDIAGMDAPQGTFNLTGIGGQFDSSLPYDEGYQLLPRFVADFDPYNTGGQDDFPPYPVGVVTTNDADGQPDSLDVACELTGIVYGVNLRPGGLQFTLIDDNNDGIGVFNGGDDLGYTVTEGDEIAVRGTIDFFNGLTQIAAEEIDLLSSGNALVDATVVTELNEETESQLIVLDDFFNLADPGEWDDSGGSFNFTITNGTDSYEVRVDSDTDIAGTPAPTMPFRLFGIGGQFDSSAPYDEGYQILPRYLDDIDFGLSSYSQRPEGWEVFPNPVRDLLFAQNGVGFDRVLLSDGQGRTLQQWQRTQQQVRIHTAQLPAGTYFLTLEKGTRRWTTPIVKQ